MTPGELDEMGAPEWVIPNVLPKECVGVVWGKSGALKTFGTLGTSVTGGKEVVITFPTGQRVSTAKVGGVGAYYENFKEAVKPAVADIREATEIAQHDGHSGWAFDVKQFEHELRFDQGSGH